MTYEIHLSPPSTGTTAIEVAKEQNIPLKDWYVVRFKGKLQDAHAPLREEGTLEFLDFSDEEGKKVFWHSTAHILAEALESLYPGVCFGIGPAIHNGFYYDVDFGEQTFSEKDFAAVEKKMKEICTKKVPFTRQEIDKKQALAYFKKKQDPYKIELLEEVVTGDLSFYRQGNFTDLCRGPHIRHTGYIQALQLLRVAGAYWRGDTDRKQLTRIYGISFPTKEQLKAYRKQLEEAEKRDHRKLGETLELFTISEQVGIGLPMWLPRGVALRESLETYLRSLQLQRGYQPVITPHIAKKELYVCSGHYEKYGKDSFQPITTPHDETFLLKPMNCPHHCEIYKAAPRSYRDLPLRLAEFGTVYRYEQHGELHGLTRVRGFTQDDAHIFCRPHQVKSEFIDVIDLVLTIFKKVHFQNYKAQLSFRDTDQASQKKYIGEEKLWEQAEKDILEAVEEKGLKYEIVRGEAAFYGPKLDFMVQDALQRSWQLGTIQVDYQLPARFSLTYKGEDNAQHQPVMIHRAPFGSLERFIALLLEHTGGNLPLWLAPVQVSVLTISQNCNDYAQEVHQELLKNDIRSAIDPRNEKLGKKIREAELKKIPHMLIIGENEKNNKTISHRERQTHQPSQIDHLKTFISYARNRL